MASNAHCTDISILPEADVGGCCQGSLVLLSFLPSTSMTLLGALPTVLSSMLCLHQGPRSRQGGTHLFSSYGGSGAIGSGKVQRTWMVASPEGGHHWEGTPTCAPQWWLTLVLFHSRSHRYFAFSLTPVSISSSSGLCKAVWATLPRRKPICRTVLWALCCGSEWPWVCTDSKVIVGRASRTSTGVKAPFWGESSPTP